MSGDILPAIAMLLVQLEESSLFLAGPRLLVYRRVQVVVPAFPALFAGAPGDGVCLFQFFSDLGPVVESKLSDELANGFVFLPKVGRTSQLQDCLLISKL